MVEVAGDLWSYWKKKLHVVLITTNGMVRKDGCLVMGRGCALQAKQKIAGLDKYLGVGVLKKGNKIQMYSEGQHILLTFPVKHLWYEKADLDLISQSAARLKTIAQRYPERTFILPRPGCGKWRTDMEPSETVVGKPAAKRVGNIRAEVAWVCKECGHAVEEPTFLNGVACVHCRACSKLREAVKS